MDEKTTQEQLKEVQQEVNSNQKALEKSILSQLKVNIEWPHSTYETLENTILASIEEMLND